VWQTAGYFETPLLAGRSFTEADVAGARRVVLGETVAPLLSERVADRPHDRDRR
jgi:hypothetical protein